MSCWLPSQMESLLQALDADNSNESTLNNWRHKLTLDWQWNKYVKDENFRTLSSWNVTVRPDFVYETNRFDYRSANDPQHLTPGYWLPQFYFQLKRGTPSLRHRLDFDLSLITSAPSVTSFDYRRASREEREALKARIYAADARGEKLYPGQR